VVLLHTLCGASHIDPLHMTCGDGFCLAYLLCFLVFLLFSLLQYRLSRLSSGQFLFDRDGFTYQLASLCPSRRRWLLDPVDYPYWHMIGPDSGVWLQQEPLDLLSILDVR